MNWLVVLATFLAAGVEWVEALTIVLAVGLYRGWRSAMAGTVLAGAALVALVAVFGLAITSYVPITLARTLVGFLLLLFGLKWLTRAVLRASGLKGMHDEEEVFRETRGLLQAHTARGPWSLDRVALSTSFSGVFLEGLEVVFIVIALGGLKGLAAPVTGAAISLAAVIAVGIAVRAPLTRVPENAMKFVVGIMLTSFGTFFAGQGAGIEWWHDDLVLLPLLAVYLAASLLLVQFLRARPRTARRPGAVERAARAAGARLWNLLVGDSGIAVFALAVLFAVGLLIARVRDASAVAGPIMVAGILGAVAVGVWDSGLVRPAPVEEPLAGSEPAPAAAEAAPPEGAVTQTAAP